MNFTSNNTYHGYNLKTYQWLDLVPPIVVMSVLAGIALFLVVLNLLTVCKCWRLSRCCKCCDRDKTEKMEGNISLWGMELIEGTLKIVFKGVFEEHDEKGIKMLFLNGQEVSQTTLNFFFLAAVLVLASAFLTFWGIFLVGESYTCDPGLDCFPFSSDGTPLQHDPIKNCSEFEWANDVTIACFQFVFRYAQGLGAFGGIITVAIMVMKTVMSITFWYFNSFRVFGPDWEKMKRLCATPVIILIFLSPVFSIVVLLLVQYVPLLSDAILTTYRSKTQFYGYWVTIIYTSTFTAAGVTWLSLQHVKRWVAVKRTHSKSDIEAPSHHSPITINVDPDDLEMPHSAAGGLRSAERAPLIAGDTSKKKYT